MKSDYAKRGYHYAKSYGVGKLYFKARERLERNSLEKDYQDWLFAGRPSAREKELQRGHRFPYSPLISVVVPLYRTPEMFLREMVESVLGQTYGNLELCLADGSGDDSLESVLSGYMNQDSRIRYRRLPENLGISGNTNAALGMATGEYVALLDHDDVLEEHALFEVAELLQSDPRPELIYTDEDKLSPDSGTFFQPHFKPDYNPELLRSNNYICHFLVVKRELTERVGGFRGEFDGAQDYDFVLRCVEQTEKIGHIPQILYHWRCSEGSTAGDAQNKSYAAEAGRRALEAHLKRCGEDARVDCMENAGFYRIHYTLCSVPKVCIVLLGAPDIGKLRKFLKAISKRRTYTNFEMLMLLDMPKKNKTVLNFIKEYRQIPIKVVYCTGACNKSVTFTSLAEKLESEYLLFLDSRIGTTGADYMELLLGNAQRKGVGAVGGRVYDSSLRLRYGARIIGLNGQAGVAFEGLKAGYTGYFHKAVLQQNYHALSGQAMMVRRDNFLKVGGFSEDVEERMRDVDLCLKLERLGLRNVYEPGAVFILQKGRAPRRRNVRPAAQFSRKWKEFLKEPDGYYNPNLSLKDTDFRIGEIY
ncbi:MAG: glycosyltransferase [Lachnospiraceae bacterium]|nr:glycosyltransferase [Lachnospiraceae bacterium]